MYQALQSTCKMLLLTIPSSNTSSYFMHYKKKEKEKKNRLHLHVQGPVKGNVFNIIGLGVTEFVPCVYISFLGCVDKIGIAFEAPTISTGFGAYLAQVRVNRLCYILEL